MIRVPKKATTGQWCSRALLLLCVVGVSTVVRGAEPAVGGQRFLWIDAEDFENYGGWTLDTQYVHLMGSAYLIATGIGQPVEDAVTEVNVSQAGRYHVWVRARNWLQEHAPGRFQVKVNGRALDKELGAASSDHWIWERAGAIDLATGPVTVALHDLTGYYGRCDAVILTTDADYQPPTAGWDSIPTKTSPDEIHPVQKERARLTGESLDPHHVGDFDVIVVGGGPAGGPAAIAAARMGMKTALIHDRPVLGGNSSDELGVGFAGASGHPNARETGIVEELERIRSFYIDHPRFSGAFRILCEQEENLTVFLNTRVIDVEMASPQRIRRAVAIDTLRGNITTYGARLFIDCTGDGWIGVFAGAELRFGREARSEFDESLAPEKPDNITMSGCLMSQCTGYRAVDTGKPAPYTPPDWAPRFTDPKTFGTKGGERKVGKIEGGSWWLEHPGTLDDMGDGERTRDELLRITFGYWDYVKNYSPRRKEAKNYALDLVPIHVGRREGCRLMGDYILNQNDTQAGRVFPDRIAYGGWSLDIHHPQGMYSDSADPYDYHPRVPIYTIPYRCLYSKNIENLFFAGRDMSVTHVALGTVRVQKTLATCGQAAGTAAAMCLKRDLSPRELGRQAIEDLQQQLLKDGQTIPAVKNEDPADLARQATATASSEFAHSHFQRSDVQVGDMYELTWTRCMSFPSPVEGHVKTVFVLLASDRAEPTELTMGLRQGQAGDDFSMAEDLATATATVPPGKRSWVRFDFNQDVSSPFAWVWLPRQPGVHWTLMTRAPRGSHRAYGLKPEGGVNTFDGSQYMALYTEPATVDGNKHPARFVNNGEVRLTKQAMNMWASDPEESMPQWIELTWDEPVTIDTAYLTFDTELNYRKHDMARVPQCVRDYEIIAHVDGRWRVVASEEDNFQRRRIHRFPPVTTKRLRVNVDATNGDPSARIYEIRAYTTTAAILGSTGIRAQTGTKASNVSGGGHGMDEEVLSQISKKIKAIVDRGQTSGAVTLVARNGEIASIDAVGWRFRNKEPLETTDVFWAASITKPFVPVAIMMLVDEKRLQLDDLVEKHIPEFRGQKVKTANGLQSPKRPLTIRNLLNHLDGLPPTRTTKSAKSIKARALASAKNPLMWEPGSKWKYGGEGLYVAAYIVEKYSGMPYTEFLKTRILDPLGMENTYFTIKDVPKSRSVPTHRILENGKWAFNERQDFNRRIFAVDGGFYTTAEDLFAWYQMLLNGGEFGGVRYISENSVRELTRKQTGDVKNAGHGPGNFHALGFQEAVEPQGRTAVLTKGSFGKGGSGGSATWVDPSTKTIYIILQNMYGGDTEIVISTVLNTAAAAIGTKRHPLQIMPTHKK